MEKSEIYMGQGCYSELEGLDGLMKARNTRANQSPLQSKIEALIRAMECMKILRQFIVIFAINCSQLVKMVLEPEEWPACASYLEDIKIFKKNFNNSELINIPQTLN